MDVDLDHPLFSQHKRKIVLYRTLCIWLRGFPLTRTMVKAFAWAVAKRSGNDKRFNEELVNIGGQSS